MTEIDIAALEKALSKKEKVKKEGQKKEPKTKKQNPDKPLLVVVDKKGNVVEPENIEVGKSYLLKRND